VLHHLRRRPLERFIYNFRQFLDPRLKELGEERMTEWRKWFDNRLDNAIEAAEVDSQLEGGNGTQIFTFSLKNFHQIQE
jgi:hypothetical protein